MGTTCSALHILFPSDQPAACIPQIEKAYARIGYKPVRKSGKDEVARTIIAGGAPGSRFLTLVDSGNAMLDSGELKEIAVHLSKTTHGIAIVTSVYDSDSFEFLLFDAGRQFDAAVSEPDGHQGGLKRLAGKKRSEKWAQHFLAEEAAAFYRDLSTGDSTAAMQRMEIAQKKLIADIALAAGYEGALAEDHLARWCEAIRLDPAQALATFADWAQDPPPNATTLAFRRDEARQAKPPQTSTAQTLTDAPQLQFYRSDDDCPYFRFYPAAWPALPGETYSFKWLVTSSAKGFDGLTLRFDLSGREGIAVSKVLLHAYPFYNGQMMSMTPLVVCEFVNPQLPAEGDWVLDAPSFALPDLDPESRKQIVIIAGVEYRLAENASVEMRATLTPRGGDANPCPLAPIKLAARSPCWTPSGARNATPWDRLTPARLCEPSVLSHCALLRDDGDGVRSTLRARAQRWLALFGRSADASIVIRTQKHMSEKSFRVAKASQTLPLASTTGEKLWPKLFETAQNFHSVFLDVKMPDATYPVAGAVMQAALQSQIHGSDKGSTLQIAFWHIDTPDAYARTGFAPERARDEFAAFMSEAHPVQAWIARAAWIPEFDLYENYAQTLYEQASDIDWFRSGLNGKLASLSWAEKYLRFVAPQMWLGAPLASRLDQNALAAVAHIERGENGLRFQIRDAVAMGDFETVLAPILPRAANLS